MEAPGQRWPACCARSLVFSGHFEVILINFGVANRINRAGGRLWVPIISLPAVLSPHPRGFGLQSIRLIPYPNDRITPLWYRAFCFQYMFKTRALIFRHFYSHRSCRYDTAVLVRIVYTCGLNNGRTVDTFELIWLMIIIFNPKPNRATTKFWSDPGSWPFPWLELPVPRPTDWQVCF